MAVSGLDKTSKCRAERIQAAQYPRTLAQTLHTVAHTGRGAGAAACIGTGIRIPAPLAGKTNYPTSDPSALLS